MPVKCGKLPSVGRILKILKYDPETGLFYWRERGGKFKRCLIGAVAGTTNSQGYRCITINGKHYRAHRLAFKVSFGRDPKAMVDHINGNPSDDRLCNLREATHYQNAQNAVAKKINTSGYKGVSWSKHHNKWRGSILANRKTISLGYFDAPERAYRAYCAAAKRLHGEFARLA
jgi:hypothetical protein